MACGNDADCVRFFGRRRFPSRRARRHPVRGATADAPGSPAAGSGPWGRLKVRTCVRFAGAHIGTLNFVQEALKKAAVGPNSIRLLEAEAENGTVRKVNGHP